MEDEPGLRVENLHQAHLEIRGSMSPTLRSTIQPMVYPVVLQVALRVIQAKTQMPKRRAHYPDDPDGSQRANPQSLLARERKCPGEYL
jgi:hypothetical protein